MPLLKSEELLLLQQLATLGYLDQVQIEPPVGC
jgi:hypothetical protein